MDNSSVKRSFKTTFFTGLFVTFPLILTVLAVKWLFLDFLDQILGGMVYKVLGHHYTGLGLVLSIILVLVVGYLATTVLGRQLLDWMEKLMMRLPVVKSFFSTFKQLADAFSPHNRSAFKKFVIVEYPRQGMHAFGFLTKECVIKDDDGEERCYNTVFIPTNHLYLGFIGLFKKEEVIFTDISMEDGVKIILSAGIAAPGVISRSRDDSAVNGGGRPIQSANVVPLTGTGGPH